MKKMIIIAIVLLVLGLGAGVLGFMAFTEAGRDEYFAGNARAAAAREMAKAPPEFSMGPTPQDRAWKFSKDAAEDAAAAEEQRILGWVFIGGAVVLVGASGVLFTLAVRKRASGTRTDPNATVEAHDF